MWLFAPIFSDTSSINQLQLHGCTGDLPDITHPDTTGPDSTGGMLLKPGAVMSASFRADWHFFSEPGCLQSPDGRRFLVDDITRGAVEDMIRNGWAHPDDIFYADVISRHGVSSRVVICVRDCYSHKESRFEYAVAVKTEDLVKNG